MREERWRLSRKDRMAQHEQIIAHAEPEQNVSPCSAVVEPLGVFGHALRADG